MMNIFGSHLEKFWDVENDGENDQNGDVDFEPFAGEVLAMDEVGEHADLDISFPTHEDGAVD